MRSRILSFLLVALCGFAGTANANWQYPGVYVGEGWYQDDGSRLTVSFRGGASMANASAKNAIGTLTSDYYYNPADGMVVSAAYYDTCVDAGGCEGFVYAGVGELASLPATKNFSAFSFAAGASIGWTVPYTPQWRIELGWDTIQKSEYNSSPVFEGDIPLTGAGTDIVIHVQSGGVQSEVTSDIVSAMAFYDFYDGLFKPIRKAIPYVGFGIGYADTKTTMNLADLYGDLSTSIDLGNFGELDDYGVLQFYRSEKTSANIAGVLAAGFSYGINEMTYLDFGIRLIYIPEIKWALTNKDDTRQRDWISADNLIYTNIMLGVRFEF